MRSFLVIAIFLLLATSARADFNEAWSNQSQWLNVVNTWHIVAGRTNSITLGSDGTLGNFQRFSGGGYSIPFAAFNRHKPITVLGSFRYHAVQGNGPWVGFSLFASEAEYWGFSVQGSQVGEYANANYQYPNTLSLPDNSICEIKIVFDGDQTTVTSARIKGSPTWTQIATRTFKPQVHPALQLNSVWNASNDWGYVDFGPITVTGEQVFELADANGPWAVASTIPSSLYLEAGVEFNSIADYGKQHFLLLAGGATVYSDVHPGSVQGGQIWMQSQADTHFPAGSATLTTSQIIPPAGSWYSELEIAGGLRQGAAGSYIKVFGRRANGDLLPDTEIPGNSTGNPFVTSTSVQKQIDISQVSTSPIYFDVQINSTSATDKLWPDTTGTTGPPILKQLAVSFASAAAASPSVASNRATMRGNFR